MGQKQSKLPLNPIASLKKFEYYNDLPVELQIHILSYLSAIDLYHATTVSSSFYHIIKYYKLLVNRRIMQRNRYCKYYACDGKIIGLYIRYDPFGNCIYFVYCGCRFTQSYKYYVKTKRLYNNNDSILSERVPRESLAPWKECVLYDNSHEKHLRELFL
jgi:hypothetical protein